MAFLLYTVHKTNLIGVIILSTTSFINVFVLCLGVCGDPGVPASVYKRWSQHHAYKSETCELEMTYSTCEAEDNVDMEQGKLQPVKRKVKIKLGSNSEEPEKNEISEQKLN